MVKLSNQAGSGRDARVVDEREFVKHRGMQTEERKTSLIGKIIAQVAVAVDGRDVRLSMYVECQR